MENNLNQHLLEEDDRNRDDFELQLRGLFSLSFWSRTGAKSNFSAVKSLVKLFESAFLTKNDIFCIKITKIDNFFE